MRENQRATLSKQNEEWMKAMQEEMQSLYDNYIFELMELPKDKKILKKKWMFRLKNEKNSS